MNNKRAIEQAGTWDDLISNLRPGRSGNEPAVHKPLLVLMLLGRAQRGEPNRVAFREIDGPLREAIARFGPTRQSYNSDYPFWHLQNDGFWVVENEHVLPRRKGKNRPLRTAMLEYNPMGYVPPGLWQELTGNSDLVWNLAQQILDRFWPKSRHAAILDAVGLEPPDGTRIARRKRATK